MASTFSPTLRIELIGDGDQSGIWGQTTNTNLGSLIEQAITGVQSITMVNANYTLTSFNGVVDEARNAVLVVGGTNGAVRDIIAPLVEKLYVIKNNTTGGFAINIRGSTGSSVSVPNGATVWVYCDGTNFNAIGTESVGNFEVNGNLTVTGNTNAVAATYTGNVVALNYSTAGNVSATGNVTATGNATAANFIGAGLTLTSINASNISAGTIANARTTANSANGASTIVARDANGSFSGNVITGTTGTFTSVSGNGVALTAINASNIASGTLATGRISGSYTGITGVGTLTAGTWNANTIPVAYGGTGVTTSTGSGNVVLSASPALTGTPTAPTAANGTNTTQIATTAFVNSAVVAATGSLGTMSTQNANNVSITGGTINIAATTAIRGSQIRAVSPNSGSTGAIQVLQNSGGGSGYIQFVDSTASSQWAYIKADSGALDLNATSVKINGYEISKGLGFGGTVWNDVTGSRSFGTTYTNSYSYPIVVSASTNAMAGSQQLIGYVNGVLIAYWKWQFNGAGAVGGAIFIVPPGATYLCAVDAGIGVQSWKELY